ncbi:MAG: hypothetical protein IJ132_00910, partial [Firmicutes bacterium]|nr:hypothetical protein [Bacillota bacterium]
MKTKKILSVIVAVAMLASVFAATPAMAKSKSKSKSGPMFVKSVAYYSVDSDTNKWKLRSNTKYFYNKQNDPQKVVELSYSGDSKSETTNKFKYKKKKKRVLMKAFNDVNRYFQLTKYNAKGKATKVNSWNREKNYKTYRTYAYDKAGFVKKFVTKYTDTYKDFEGKKKTFSGKTEYTYKTTYKKGLPQKIEATRKEDNVASNYKYITTFNAKGQPTKVERQYQNDTPETRYTYKYKYKKGRVVSAVEYSYSYDGKKTPEAKYVFKYTKAKTNKKNYASMINNMLDLGSAYAEFLW